MGSETVCEQRAEHDVGQNDYNAHAHTCPVCRAEITGTELIPAMQATPIEQEVEESSWVCGTCTFENSMIILGFCEMCGT